MTAETLLTQWTIRLALLLYAAVLGGEILGRNRTSWATPARLLWTVGCGLFLAHVACAMHFYHEWSHAAVLADTARQTKELLDWEFGEGIYFSYAFLLLWVADVLQWWILPQRYRERSPWLHYAVHGYMFFIVFNGTVIFEGGLIRGGALAVCLGLGFLLAWRMLGRKAPLLCPEKSAPS